MRILYCHIKNWVTYHDYRLRWGSWDVSRRYQHGLIAAPKIVFPPLLSLKWTEKNAHKNMNWNWEEKAGRSSAGPHPKNIVLSQSRLRSITHAPVCKKKKKEREREKSGRRIKALEWSQEIQTCKGGHIYKLRQRAKGRNETLCAFYYEDNSLNVCYYRQRERGLRVC